MDGGPSAYNATVGYDRSDVSGHTEERSMVRVKEIATLCGALALGACAVAPPAGPTVMALPGQGKDFTAFQQDDALCRQFAAARTGGTTPAEGANSSLASSAVAGTLLGAAAGAAIGAAVGNPAAGAAIGAGSGLFLGGASGASAAGYSAATIQQAYDMSYVQCMYAKGDSVPTAATAPAPAVAFGYPYPAYAYYPYAYPYGPYYYPGFYGPVGFVGVGFGHFHR
jgi:hypothetical protein